MQKLLLISCLLFLTIRSQAQMDPLYAQYLNNPLVINPAYTGLNNDFNASVTYRKQWAGFVGSPTTINASAHTSLANNKMGLGLLIVQDKIGSTKNTEIHATYSYKIDLGSKDLSFGLQAGFINFRSNDDLNPYDQNDPAFVTNQNSTKPSFGAGILLKSERYFFGLSVPRLLNENTTTGTTQTNLYSQHFYAMAAYLFYISEKVRFKPSVLVKGVKGAPLSVDYNASFVFDQRYTVGLFTRNLNAYGFLTQLKFGSGLRFGYTFEVPTNNSVGTRFTTHEVSLGLNMAVFTFQRAGLSNF
jgi:type IX secretion system PorP/SprF family membrane protein